MHGKVNTPTRLLESLPLGDDSVVFPNSLFTDLKQDH
jgi:hypothetical protein